MNPIEIQKKGYQALIEALGYEGMVQFLQQLNAGRGDYTQERHQWLDELTLEDILTDIEQRRAREKSKSERETTE